MKVLLVAVILTIINNHGLAFQDTITLKNGDSIYYMIHEYNQKNKISTSFSKGDFWIKTPLVVELKSMSRFTSILYDGRIISIYQMRPSNPDLRDFLDELMKKKE